MGQIRDRWKHWYRHTAVSVAPYAYWRARHALRGHEEPELCLLPQLCAPSATVIDVGGNFGMYTYWMSRLAARCVVFEPIPALASALRRGFGDRIELHDIALSDKVGTAELVIPRTSPGLSTIETRNRLTEGALNGAKRILVKTQPLDDFALTNVSFIKVDVEGHEEAVLNGATKLLAAEQPALLLELEERHNPGCIARVTQLLNGFGLEGAVIQQGKLVSLDTFDALENQRTVPQADYVRGFVFAKPSVLEHLTLETTAG